MKPLLQISKLTLLLVLLASSAPSASAFYDAGMGRWINRDPITENGGINQTLFVANDPLSKTDPYGLTCCVNLGGCTLVRP